MNISYIGFSNKIGLAYSQYCRPFCRKIGLTQSAFNILMFLANNPEHNSSRDICVLRGMKQSAVSSGIWDLTKGGYITRQPSAEDRRIALIFLTDKAQPIIKKGREIQQSFRDEMLSQLSDDEIEVFKRVMTQAEANLDKIISKTVLASWDI